MKLAVYGYILILAILWGPSIAMLKIIRIDFPPITAAALRIAIAAIVLLFITVFTKDRFPRSPKKWLHATVMGFFASSFPFIIFSYVVTDILTMWGGVIIGLLPMLTALLGHFFLNNEKLNSSKVFGIMLGFTGVLILLVPTLLDANIGLDTLGLLWLMLAALCYAIGMVYTRRYLTDLRGLVGPTMQLGTGALYMIPLAFLVESPLQVELSSWIPVTNLLLLSVLGTSLAFALYFYINRCYGATSLAMVGYLLPIIGTVLGILIFDEPLTVAFCIACAFVISGMFFVNRAIKVNVPTIAPVILKPKVEEKLPVVPPVLEDALED